VRERRVHPSPSMIQRSTQALNDCADSDAETLPPI
jgi:hypothetical protein